MSDSFDQDDDSWLGDPTFDDFDDKEQYNRSVNQVQEVGSCSFAKMSINSDYDNESLLNLKYPPILTQRTVPTLSTSAPKDSYSLQNGLPVKKQTIEQHPYTPIPPRNTVQLFTSPEDLKPSPQQEIPKEFTKPTNRFKIPFTLQQHSPFASPSNMLWKHRDTSPSETERRTRTTHIHEKTKNSPNLVGYEDNDSFIGTVPRTALLKQIKLKSNVNARMQTLKKTHGSFTTISSLSFDAHLSPDTPKIVLGDPKTATVRILITVGIHGDEPCGLIGFNELLAEDFFAALPSDVSVTVVVGNPAAVMKGVRFIEFNLNRMIRKDLFSKGAYESERARVIAREINECDVLLDLHSCSAKSPAHALPANSPESILLASRLPVGYVIKYLVHTTSGAATTIDWAHSKKKTSLCVECGQHDDRETVDNAKNVMKTVIGLCSKQLNAEELTHTAPVILNSKENESVRKGFHFVRAVDAFERVPYGEVIAVDDIVGEIRSKYEKGTYIVMPTKKPVFGEEAWFNASLSETLFD